MQVPPRRESLLVPWMLNLNTGVQADAAALGVPASVASELDSKVTTYITLWNATQVPTTRTKPGLRAKDDARLDALKVARQVMGLLQSMPFVTNEQREELGLRIRDVEPTPVPPPSSAPVVTILSVVGRLVTVLLQDAENLESRSRPAGVKGATIFSFAGESPPQDLTGYKFEGNVTRTKFTVQFPDSVPVGSKVFVTAFWRNPTDESGPVAVPASTQINYGGLVQAS